MEISMNGDLDERLVLAARRFGADKVELVRRAVLFYLDAVEREVELKGEFDSWESLSDEALVKFEERL